LPNTGKNTSPDARLVRLFSLPIRLERREPLGAALLMLARVGMAGMAAGSYALTPAAAEQLVPLQDYVAQTDVAADPAAFGYVASRCSALYLVFAKNLEGETDPERQEFRAQALKAGEKFMGVAVQSMMSGTTIGMPAALARTRIIVVELGNLYTDRISTARLLTNNMFSDVLIAGDWAICKGLNAKPQ
jgi:hypothetical protein